MGKNKKVSLQASLLALEAVAPRLILMEKFKLHNREKSIKLLEEIIDAKFIEFKPKVIKKTKKALAILLEFVEKAVPEEEVERLRNFIKATGIDAMTAIQNIDMEKVSADEYNEVLNGETKNVISRKNITKLKSFLGQEDWIEKSVGDKVYISHELLTNMLVNTEGIQLPSESFNIPAAKELANIPAIVIETGCSKYEYLCGACTHKHIADTKIVFDDYTMEFYIHHSFIKIKEDEK